MTDHDSTQEKEGLLSLPKDFATTMKSQPKYKWFKPILAFLLFVVLYMVFNTITDIINSAYKSVAFDPSIANLKPDAYLDIDLADPIGIFIMVLGIAILIPAAVIAVKATGLGSLGTLSSAQGKIRWDIFKKVYLPILGVGFVLIALTEISSIVMRGNVEELANPVFSPLALIAIFLFVPFQCAAEEYAFRGFVLQAFGSWIPVVAIPVILQSFCFAAMHGYDLLGNIGILVNGLLWGWLAVKTGGIEVPICLHAANNVSAMLVASIYAAATPTTSASATGLITTVLVSLLMAAFAYFLCKKNGLIVSSKSE